MTKPFCTVGVGDFIRSYHKGIHKVTKIKHRFVTEKNAYILEKVYGPVGSEYSSLVYYITIIDGNMNIKKKPGKEQCCDAAFCKLVSPADLYAEGRELKNKYDAAGTHIYDELGKK